MAVFHIRKITQETVSEINRSNNKIKVLRISPSKDGEYKTTDCIIIILRFNNS